MLPPAKTQPSFQKSGSFSSLSHHRSRKQSWKSVADNLMWVTPLTRSEALLRVFRWSLRSSPRNALQIGRKLAARIPGNSLHHPPKKRCGNPLEHATRTTVNKLWRPPGKKSCGIPGPKQVIIMDSTKKNPENSPEGKRGKKFTFSEPTP